MPNRKRQRVTSEVESRRHSLRIARQRRAEQLADWVLRGEGQAQKAERVAQLGSQPSEENMLALELLEEVGLTFGGPQVPDELLVPTEQQDEGGDPIHRQAAQAQQERQRGAQEPQGSTRDPAQARRIDELLRQAGP